MTVDTGSAVLAEPLGQGRRQSGARDALCAGGRGERTWRGLSDGAPSSAPMRARADLDQRRELPSAWRDVRRTARDVIVGWLARVVLVLLIQGLAVCFGLVAPARR